MIKYLLVAVIALAMLFAACTGQPATTTSSTPVTGPGTIPGDSIAPAAVQKNLINALNVYESVAGSDCANPRISNTEIVQKPTEQNGPWVERWTIDRCGKATATYLITFTPDPKTGSASLSIEQEKKK